MLLWLLIGVTAFVFLNLPIVGFLEFQVKTRYLIKNNEADNRN